MEEKKTFKSWVKEHKKELIITGTTVVAVVGTFLLVKEWDVVKDIVPRRKVQDNLKLDNVEDVIPEKLIKTNNLEIQQTPVVKIVDVREHVRNLAEGYRPSERKVIEAADAGIKLAANQTFVSAHPRSYVA